MGGSKLEGARNSRDKMRMQLSSGRFATIVALFAFIAFIGAIRPTDAAKSFQLNNVTSSSFAGVGVRVNSIDECLREKNCLPKCCSFGWLLDSATRTCYHQKRALHRDNRQLPGGSHPFHVEMPACGRGERLSKWNLARINADTIARDDLRSAYEWKKARRSVDRRLQRWAEQSTDEEELRSKNVKARDSGNKKSRDDADKSRHIGDLKSRDVGENSTTPNFCIDEQKGVSSGKRTRVVALVCLPRRRRSGAAAIGPASVDAFRRKSTAKAASKAAIKAARKAASRQRAKRSSDIQKADLLTINKCCPPGEYYDTFNSVCRLALNKKDIGKPLSSIIGGPDSAVSETRHAWIPTAYDMASEGFTILNNVNVRVKMPHCVAPHSQPVLLDNQAPAKFILLSDGSLFQLGVERLIEDPNEFCLDASIKQLKNGSKHEFHIARTCQEDHCANKTCVRKCCGRGGFFNEVINECSTSFNHYSTTTGSGAGAVLNQDSPSPPDDGGIDSWHPTFYDLQTMKPRHPQPDNYQVISGYPICEHYVLDSVENGQETFFVLNDGSLYTPSNGFRYTPQEYCVDGFTSPNGTTREKAKLCYLDKDTTALKQRDSGLANRDQWRFVWSPIGLTISIIFLFATLLIGSVIPERRALHGQLQLSHIISLICAYVLLAIIQGFGNRLPPGLCETVGILLHLFTMAAFFWLNAMCFNIWATLRAIRPGNATKTKERRKFLFYSLYAWGCPSVITIITIILNFAPGLPPHFLTPKIGFRRCWFDDSAEILAYFYGPVAVLVSINILLFILTSKELLCGLWSRDNGAVRSARSRASDSLFHVCLKLFIIMGVTWGLDVVSWFAGGPEFVWYISDIANSLQGVLIFLAVVLRRQVLESLRQKFRQRGWPCCQFSKCPTSSNANQSCRSTQDANGVDVSYM